MGRNLRVAQEILGNGVIWGTFNARSYKHTVALFSLSLSPARSLSLSLPFHEVSSVCSEHLC